MAQTNIPMLPKRGSIRFLALILLLLIACTQADIRAKPTKIVEQIATVELSQEKIEQTTLPTSPVTAVSLEDPKPKIDPKLVEELKRQRKHQRVKILLEAKDEESLQKIREAVQQAGGKVEQSFDIGDIAVVEVQSDKVEELSEVVGVEQISTEKEYIAFLQDRIPAFSIDTVWSNNITGKNVKIAILDTGVGPHDKINVAAGESFVEGESADDQSGHGTHVAGIAQGVAKDAVIYNAKVLNKNGAGTTSQILAGINWAVQQDADIISMSFGGMFTELDGPLASAVKEAMQNGVVFVVASGNCKTGCGGFYGVTTPGNVKEVITVGAVDDNNVVASFSSGDTFDGYIKPDVVAPGIDITSAWLNNGQKTLSGTSMSAPFTAGIAALLLEKEPGLTHEQVKQKLESTAEDKGEAGKDEGYGAGILSVPDLLQSNFTIPNPSIPENTPDNTFSGLPALQLIEIVNVPQTPGVETKIELYQNPGEKSTRIGHTLFADEQLLQDFVTRYAPYDHIVSINGFDVYYATEQHYVFWINNLTFYWAMASNITDPIEQNEVVAHYVSEFPPQDLTVRQLSRAVYEAQQALNWTEPVLFESQGEGNPWQTANNGCTDSLCDDNNYKTDLPTTTCHLQTRYPVQGTTHSAEWDCNNDKTDLCVDSTTLREYYLNCDGGTALSVCPCVGFLCDPDLVQSRNKACTDLGANYICSNGACVQNTCTYSPTCTNNVRRTCTSQTGYDKSTATTACNGGCTGFTYTSSHLCSNGAYCQGSTTSSDTNPQYPCSTCSTACDGLCQSSTCFTYDTDCTQSGGVDPNACNPQCAPGYTGNKRCSGGIPQRQYQNADCTTTWQNQPACSAGTTCQSGDCVSVCDNDGLCDSGETKTNCPSDCNKGIGTGCTASNQCSTNFCDGNTGTCQAATSCTDADQDGYGNPGSATCSSGSTLPDCDESKPFVNPGAIEQCNSIDDNCNGQTDEGGVCTPQPNCNDQDGDGYGNPATGCPQSLPDCDDSKSNVHPNAPEICDGFDNDCDGSTDEANVCCGNQQCDTSLGESPQTCGQDCYTSYQITGIQAPSSANQGQTIQVTASITNTGTWPGTTNIEGGIIPDGWLPFSSSKCCSNNNFFSTQQTTIQPGQTNNVQFTLTAPGILTKDSCGGQSAWDSSHEITIGLYGNCGSTYQVKSTQDIKIQDKPCTKQSDCTIPLEKCNIQQGSTTGICQANTCTNLCTNGQYMCSGETIRHCEDTNSDGCYEWKDTTVCPPGQTCVPGQSSCTTVQISTEPLIEEAASGNVYEQIDDNVILNLKYVQQEQITLYYNSNQFELDTTTCQQAFTISEDAACRFKVKTELQGAELGVQKQNTIKTARAKVVTTSNHNGIIITNKKKLSERFAGQETGIQNLLSEAYGFADHNNLIIYDLQELPIMHPWANFPTYQETIANPFMVDNTLAVEIGKYIREKCIPPQCQSTLILGDDYVVPHYRRYAQFLNSYFFSPAINTQLLYSEIPYVERTTKEFSQLDEVLSDDGIAKPVVIIKPDTVSAEMRTAIDRLKSTLQANFSSSPTERSSSTVTCNDPQLFNNLNGVTVIIIGTEQNNRAYNCMPFVAGLENRDSAFLEVNPWDGGEYSIVINTENPQVISTFSDALRTGAYKKILGRHWYFIEMAVTISSFASIACGPIPCDIIIDAVDSGIQCNVKQDALMCGVSSTMLVIPYVPSGPVKLAVKAFVNYVGPAGEAFIMKYGPGAVTFLAGIGGKIDDFQAYFKKAADHFGTQWNTISKVLARTPADERAISEGVRILEKKFGKTLDQFEPSLIANHNPYRAKLLLTAGRLSDDFFEKGWEYSRQGSLLRGASGGESFRQLKFANGFKAENKLKRSTEDLISSITDNADAAFIDSTTDFKTAKKFATTNNAEDGWIFKIRNRGGQVINAADTPSVELAAQTNDALRAHIYGDPITGRESEFIHSFVDDIGPEDIEGAWRVTKDGIRKEWVLNPNFAGTPSETFGLLEAP